MTNLPGMPNKYIWLGSKRNLSPDLEINNNIIWEFLKKLTKSSSFLRYALGYIERLGIIKAIVTVTSALFSLNCNTYRPLFL